jgi:glycosyltransferase involved in cell wall biosynthesis
MRLGLVARADNSGLGMQTWEFYRHMHPDKTMVVDISHLNGNQVFPDRYPDGIFIKGFPRAEQIDNFLEDLDCLFVAESPYNYYLYARAKQLGVKVAVQYNYEFFDWFAHPDYPTPDMLIAPSKWHFDDIDAWAKPKGIKHVYLHCPVNRDALKFRTISQARVFLHTAGRSAAHDRNGTKTVIEASAHLRTNASIVIHFQGEQGLAHQTTMTTADYEAYAAQHGDLSKLKILKRELFDYSDVYAMGDVLIMPRRYGGNCLPVNEALSVGMPAVMTDISPNNQFLPPSWLVPAIKINQFEPRTVIDIYDSSASKLANMIDRFFEMSEDEFLLHNTYAGDLAESISWKNMERQYRRVFEDLCTLP